MCFAFNLCNENRETLHNEYMILNVNLARQVRQASQMPVAMSIEDIGAMKRSSTTTSEDGPPAKRAKFSNTHVEDSQVIEIPDDSPSNSEERQTTATSTDDSSEGLGNTPMPQDDAEPNQMVRTKDAEEHKIKTNRVIKSKNVRIKELEDERENMQAKVASLEAISRCFESNIKKTTEAAHKKMHDMVKADYDMKLKKMDAEYREKLEIAKEKLEKSSHIKEERLKKKLTSQINKHIETIASKQEKLEALEVSLSESKANAKQVENELRAQHREELKQLKPEHATIVKEFKADLKAKETAMEKLTEEINKLKDDRDYYQGELSTVGQRNASLQNVVRDQSHRLISSQEEATTWKQNATEFEQARDAIKKSYESKLNSRDEEWLHKYDKQYISSQESNIALAGARRGIFVLNQANERNNKRIRELEGQLTDMSKKLAEAKREIAERLKTEMGPDEKNGLSLLAPQAIEANPKSETDTNSIMDLDEVKLSSDNVEGMDHAFKTDPGNGGDW